MYKTKKIVALIPARGGSKGIPNKNILPIAGKPLIEYTINAAKQSKFIDDIYISTDSIEIHDYATQCGCISNGLRPFRLATDKARTIDVLVYEVNLFKRYYDYIILLQPTQPLRQPQHIDESIKKMIDKYCISLVSVSEVEQNPLLTRKIEGDRLIPILSENSSVRRQEFKKYYFVNGMIYINRISDINPKLSLNDNITPYIIDNRYFVDIDEPADIEKFLIKHKGIIYG